MHFLHHVVYVMYISYTYLPFRKETHRMKDDQKVESIDELKVTKKCVLDILNIMPT